MSIHITVLMEEALEGLQIESEDIIVDATLGAGGHSKRILSELSNKGKLIALDVDEEAVASNQSLLADNSNLVVQNFKDIDIALAGLEIKRVDGILADLGWRMDQMGGNGKGLSFQIDEPLLMTFGNPEDYLFTARDIVNDWDEENIVEILKGYGGERFPGRIARHIVEARKIEPIETSVQLAEIIKEAVPGMYKSGKIHPATRTFQALRIAVNDELGVLKQFIEKSIELLEEEGRLVIITFHSTEDRVVKRAFKELSKDGKGDIVTKKPIAPTREETKENPRARSAKLRIFQKNEKA